MKATDLIEDLRKFIEMYGDQPVSVFSPNKESDDHLALVYGLVPITDSGSDPKEFVICCEELYDTMYETCTSIQT
jgi:hypothetical protein